MFPYGAVEFFSQGSYLEQSYLLYSRRVKTKTEKQKKTAFENKLGLRLMEKALLSVSSGLLPNVAYCRLGSKES